MAQSMAPLAILGGESVSEVLARLLRGTKLAQVLGGTAEISLAGADSDLDRIVAHVVDGTAIGDLPLDLRGTVFQRAVWTELRRIPRGQTRTYREIAERVGQPKAVRAVANACASNPAALAVPCHRVVRTDGSLGGYRWGVARKQAILNLEQSA